MEANTMDKRCADIEGLVDPEIAFLAESFEDPQIEVAVTGPSANSYPQPKTTKCC
jgi:hypothetical protein